MFYHCVHFWLKDDITDDERDKFLKGVRTLATSSNVESVRIGIPAGTDRSVVDNSWSVQLLAVFRDRDAHDRYQSGDDPVHQEFIRQNETYWTKVLIYDSIEAD